jgi:Tfp pilus assembly protein PilF
MTKYGITLVKQGDREGAIRQYRRALEIAPQLENVKKHLAEALGEKQADSEAGEKK